MESNKLKIKIILASLVLVLVLGFLAFILFGRPGDADSGRLDSFAQCIASKGITMYGAAWCPHCQSQKNRFGSSFKFVPYVECPADPKLCLAKGVVNYPTWIFPGDKRLVGDQELQKLSDESGCQLPAAE